MGAFSELQLQEKRARDDDRGMVPRGFLSRLFIA